MAKLAQHVIPTNRLKLEDPIAVTMPVDSQFAGVATVPGGLAILTWQEDDAVDGTRGFVVATPDEQVEAAVSDMEATRRVWHQTLIAGVPTFVTDLGAIDADPTKRGGHWPAKRVAPEGKPAPASNK